MTRFHIAGTACAFAFLAVSARFAIADPVVKLNGEGILYFADEGPSEFFMTGQGSHLGEFLCFGEVAFIPGEEEGSLVGIGIAVFEAANGDLLVGEIFWEIDSSGDGQAAIPWRDSVTLSDGTIIESTGRFAHSRPGGALPQTSLSSRQNLDISFTVR